MYCSPFSQLGIQYEPYVVLGELCKINNYLPKMKIKIHRKYGTLKTLTVCDKKPTECPIKQTCNYPPTENNTRYRVTYT